MDLEARLDRLERENQRLKRLGLVSLVIASSFVFMGQTKRKVHPETLRAQQFELVEPDGSVKAILGTTPTSDKSSGLALYDRQGKVRVMLSVDKEGVPVLALFSANSRSRAVTTVTDEGSPAFLLYGPKGEMRGLFGMSANSAANSLLFDASGEPRSGVSVPASGKIERVP